MGFFSKLFSGKSEPAKRVRGCSECGMPVAEQESRRNTLRPAGDGAQSREPAQPARPSGDSSRRRTSLDRRRGTRPERSWRLAWYLNVWDGRAPSVLHINTGSDGRLTATLDSIDQGASGIPVTSIALKASTLSVAIAVIKVCSRAGSAPMQRH